MRLDKKKTNHPIFKKWTKDQHTHLSEEALQMAKMRVKDTPKHLPFGDF